MQVQQSTQSKARTGKNYRNSQKTTKQHEKSNLNRLKSQEQQNSIQAKIRQKMNKKPRSSLEKRPPSAASKHTQTMNSITTTSSSKNQTEIRTLVSYSIAHNPKVKDFIKKINLSQQEAKQRLLQNQIFTLSLINAIGGTKSSDQINSIVQKAVISKIQKMLIFENQIRNCQQRENKITSLIDSRLRALSCFHNAK